MLRLRARHRFTAFVAALRTRLRPRTFPLHLNRAPPTFFTYLPDCFGAYLHQDFDLYASTPAGVAARLANTASHDDVRGTVGDLVVLALLVGGDDAIGVAVEMSGANVTIASASSESDAVRSLADAMAAAAAARIEREQRR